jgi:peptide-methionine (S)-S-oxide reductase
MYKKATFGAGCFWGVEVTFRAISGVKDVCVGYTGGHVPSPSYEQVCTGETGHVESVEVLFDPNEVSYRELLGVFWKNHNPTTPNQQGPDHGTQYRSAIFYHDEEQKAIAEASLEEIRKDWKEPIVTEIVASTEFYPAEEYHQRYFEKRGIDPSCRI